MLRRKFLLSVAAAAILPLAACTGTTVQTTTLADVVAQIRDKCKYQTEWQSIAAIVVTILAGFNAAAGEATAIGVGVANQVVTLICNAVEEKLASMKSMFPNRPLGGSLPIVVIGPNGERVEIQGELVK